jgi:hypothetical protein
MRAAGGAILLVGLAVLGVLGLGVRKAMLLERALDAGDFVVLSVFALFGLFCVAVGGWLWRSEPQPPAASQAAPAAPAGKRATASHICSTAGVLLLMACVLVPAHGYPVVLLFAGIASLAVAHVLTPCEERLDKLRKARASLRQL